MNQSLKKHLLVTGGAGFIGSNFVALAKKQGYRITVLDALTYAGHFENLQDVLEPSLCDFVQGNIHDRDLVSELFSKHHFGAVVHFAAESHVDNSISGPAAFLKTNVMGTFDLLEATRGYWNSLSAEAQKKFRFVHISTDEVFGALGATGKFSEDTAYAPNSPYSASKAGSDHLVRAWFHTYKLPTIITNCSNNYGPFQFPEKLIPRMITLALKGEHLPVYGKGENIRDWIHVTDHCQGVLLALEKGEPGQEYCLGGNSECSNIDVVRNICRILDREKPRAEKYESLIKFVEDRAGHDFRYAIDDSKAQKELGFAREYKTFEDGLEETVKWYLDHPQWIASVTNKKVGKA